MTGGFARGAALGLALGLAACQSGGGGFSLAGGSPAGKPIALERIQGVSPSVESALASELAAAAPTQRVEMASTSSDARYRLMGYLSTEVTEDGGTALAFVWDVYDTKKRRAGRVSGSAPVRLAAGQAIDGLDKEALARLAARSMEEIAGFLSAGVPDEVPPAG